MKAINLATLLSILGHMRSAEHAACIIDKQLLEGIRSELIIAILELEDELKALSIEIPISE